MRLRDLSVAGAIALAVGSALALPAFDSLRAISTDVLFWLRYEALGRQHNPATSPTVVIAIDEETYRRDIFKDKPRALWTKELAPVLNALVEADAKVIGFDVIFPTSARSIEGIDANYDRDFLIALNRAAKQDKVVLGKVQHQQLPVSPHPSQSAAVGHQKNIRSNNLVGDSDERIRRAPLFFEAQDSSGNKRREASMSLELASRTLGEAPLTGPDGTTKLAGQTIPGSKSNSIVVNFDHGNDIPTFSLADLHACTKAGNGDFFRQHFRGKVVLLGAVEDLDDRKLTSKRLMLEPDSTAFARCVYPEMDLLRKDLKRDTLPGVYIHATAVNNLLRGEALEQSPSWLNFALGVAMTAMAAASAALLPATAAAAAMAALGGVWVLAAIAALQHGTVLPLLVPFVGMVLAFGAELGWRFIVADRDKRLLRKSFSLYLSATEVEKMLKSEKMPELGGEQRKATVMFTDLRGFTTFSETVTPAELVAILNEYLSAMADIVEEHRGFVDNFIGDGIMAVFGVPLEDPDHALNAVKCAMACRKKLAEMNQSSEAFSGHKLAMRIGINTGEVLAGNIGSRRRLKYTVMGDAVNLAARLEGANKSYNTTILVSQDTYETVGEKVEWREIDCVRVKGRHTPVTIFEPLDEMSETPRALTGRYAEALAAYRAGRFEEAEAAFARLAETDPTAATFRDRSRRLKVECPAIWDPITVLETK